MVITSKTREPKEAAVATALRPREDLSWYSLGAETLRANGIEGGRAVINVNYTTPDYRYFSSQEGYNRSSNNARAVPAVRENEVVVTVPLLPGYEEYLRGMGLIPKTSEIIQVDTTYVRGNKKYNYPHGDVLEQPGAVALSEKPDLYHVPAFPGIYVDMQAKKLGLNAVGIPDAFVTNNKVIFRKDAQRHGFPVLPGIEVFSQRDIEVAALMFADSPRGVWMKYPYASGGALVYPVPKVTSESLAETLSRMRSEIKTIFGQRESGVSMREFWPNGSVVPAGVGVIIESDARNHGTILVNGNTQVFTYKDGEMRIIKHTEQITGETGNFGGSITYSPDESTRMLIQREVIKAAGSIQDRGYYGNMGVDWFLMENNGALSVYVTEVNARWNGSTYATIIADKLGVEHWMSASMNARNPVTGRAKKINTIDDFIRLVGPELAFGSEQSGMAVPMLFRTYVNSAGVVPSSSVKVLVVGSSEEHRGEVLKELARRGVETDE